MVGRLTEILEGHEPKEILCQVREARGCVTGELACLVTVRLALNPESRESRRDAGKDGEGGLTTYVVRALVE